MDVDLGEVGHCCAWRERVLSIMKKKTWGKWAIAAHGGNESFQLLIHAVTTDYYGNFTPNIK